MGNRWTTIVLSTCVTGLILLGLSGLVWAGRAVYKEAEIDVARANLVRQDVAKTILKTLRVEADRWAAKSDDELRNLLRAVTPRGASTVCPLDGGTLDCKMDDPWGLVCRKCGTRYPGNKYPDEGLGCLIDGKTFYFVGRCNAHHIGVLTGAAHDLSLAYALTGKVEYACKSAVILKRLGEIYPDFLPHDVQDVDGFGAGRATASTQTESGWLKVVVSAYELIRDAHDPAGNPVITPDAKTAIEGGLLRPAAQLLMNTSYGMHSIQAAQNSAVAAVGVCLDEPAYVHFAVDGPTGFRSMLANALLDDGFWHEGAVDYHTYAMSCLLQLAHYTKGYSDPVGVTWNNRLDRYENLDLESTPRLQRMIAAVNRSILPDGAVPALNDSPARNGLEDSEAVAATHRLADQWSAGMEWVPFRQLMHSPGYALLFRADQRFEKLAAAPPRLPAYDLAGFGLTVLRSDLGERPHVVALDHSLQLDSHTHPDLLQMLMWVNGSEQAADYGPMGTMQSPDRQRWASHTVAHNTVVVDRSDQRPDALPALVGLDAAGSVRTLEVDAAQAYLQCPDYRRAVLMMGRDYVLDVFRVTGGTRHEYAFHASGKLSVQGVGNIRRLTKAAGTETGFRELEDFQKGSTQEDFEATWQTPSADGSTRGLRLIMLGDGSTTLRFGPGYRFDETHPVNMILAERGPGLRQFISVIEPLTGLPKLKTVKLLDNRWVARRDKPACSVQIEGDGWTDLIHYVPARKSEPGCWSLSRAQQGHMKLLYCTNGAAAGTMGWSLRCAEPVIGKTGQVKMRDGSPQILLDLPVTWGKASSELDIVIGQAGKRMSRYKAARLDKIGNAAWATLAKEPGITLATISVDDVGPLTRCVDTNVPLPRRLELIGKSLTRADEAYLTTVKMFQLLMPGWTSAWADGEHPPESPVRLFFNLDGDLGDLKTGETLKVMDVALHTPVRVESSALLEELAPDTFRLTAPLGAKVTFSARNDQPTKIEWRQGDAAWTEIKPAETGGDGFPYIWMMVEFPVKALADGPVEFRLLVQK